MKIKNPSLIFAILISVFVAGAVFATTANAAMYYISPIGSDSNSGSSSSPWKTFNFAISRLLPGDTLLLKNGTYTTSNSGLPDINCGANAKNGTASQRIAIKAENERQAFLSDTGSSDYNLHMENCSYWNIEGLRIEGGDFKGAGYGEPVYINNSSNLIVKRLLVARNNRYQNVHLTEIHFTTNSLFEENEYYYFHRHAIFAFKSNGNRFRRNYFNSRGYADIPSGLISSSPSRGEASIAIYPGSNNISENNISEGNLTLINIEALGDSINNRFYGNISLNDLYGALVRARGTTASYQPRDTFIKDLVVVNPGEYGGYFRANKNTVCQNCSFLGGTAGFVADVEPGDEGDGISSAFSTNTLAANTSGYGFRFTNQTTWAVDYSYSYNHAVNYSGVTPSNVPSINPTSMTKVTTSCTVFVPATSPLKKAGKDGSDIGANILYRYQDGILTNQPLWDPQTGEFPHGAIVPGVNNIAGSSAFDVHNRLNINTNGCSLPGSVVTPTAPSAPRNLVVTGQ